MYISWSSIGLACRWHRFDSTVWQGIFLPQSTFSADSLTVHTLPCALACIHICVHIKDPIVHVRVQWVMETLKHPACTVGWLAWLFRSWLSLGKATWISHGRYLTGTIHLLKKKDPISSMKHVWQPIKVAVSPKQGMTFVPISAMNHASRAMYSGTPV